MIPWLCGELAKPRRRSRFVEPSQPTAAQIPNFAGYTTEENRRTADEQVRGFVGERLANLPASSIDALSADERARYDRVLLHCEFLNQGAFHVFDRVVTQESLDPIVRIDAELVAAASEIPGAQSEQLGAILERLENLFERRDRAMLHE